MNIVITLSATEDIADGHLFYEEKETGLGYYFETSIFSDIRSLHVYAGVHEVWFGKYFRKICSTFPYAIFYTVEASEVRIHAILDLRRDPLWISDRLN